MTFMRKFDTLLRKSNNTMCKIDSQDGINLYIYDNNFRLLSSKELLDGDFSFLDYWFDIDINNNVYGIINDKKGTLLSYNITNKYLIKNSLLKYNPDEKFIKFVYINSNTERTNIFYYIFNTDTPYSGSLIHHYKINNIWYTHVIDSISYNVLTNFVVVYDNHDIPIVFYYKLSHGVEELFISIFDADSNSWCTPIQITDSRKAKIYLSVIKDYRNCYHILFSENNSNKYYCTYINGYINNYNFNISNSLVISDTVACTFPNILESQGRLYAHWVEYHNLYVGFSDDYGNKWNKVMIYNDSLENPFVCCNYHSNCIEENTINYFTLYMNQNSNHILGID
ncbi:MAG: hypothetical protein Q4F66_05990 [Clostridium sp.]|nr:hypothetical protein [Clostridium sp.]